MFPRATPDINLNFTPVPSLASIFTLPKHIKFVAVLGPVGSTKTTTCLYKLLAMAAQQEPSPDGIRRTRFAIIRKTLVGLKQTVLKDAISLFGSFVEWRQQEGVIRVRVADIDSEWLFMPMETAVDQQRLGSLQLSAVYVNEARELTFSLLISTFARCGRFPSPMHGGVRCTTPLLIFDSNMGVEDSELYKFLEEEAPPELHYIHQPSALSVQADWVHLLRENYYADIMIGAKRAWIDTHVHSMWSEDLEGEPIFAEVFDYEAHVSRRTLSPVYDRSLIVGLDPGLNPAALITQTTDNGRMLVLAETYAPNRLFGDFLDNYLTPLLRSPRFLRRRVIIIADPAARTRQATSETTAYGMIEDAGYEVEVAATNALAPRLNVIEQWLTRMVPITGRATELRRATADGNAAPVRESTAALQIDPGCTVLINGLLGKYRYKLKKSGELEVTPEKKHPISDVMDCFGYAGVGMTVPRVRRRMRGRAFNSRKRQETPDPRAWTA